MNVHVLAPKTGAKNYMAQARWMVDVINRHSLRDYDTILEKLVFSDERAGAPARRLANAVWDFEARINFPKRPALATAEENGFAHLCAEHRSVPKSRRYRVWYAIEAFYQLREGQFGPPLLVPMEVGDLDQRDATVEKALFRLDHWATKTRKAYLGDITRICLREVDPAMAKPLEMLGETVWALEYWRAGGCTDNELKKRYLKANSRLWHFRKTSGWVENTPLGKALALLDASFNK